MSADCKVTLCMITKNEHDTLARCINSVRHLVDEIIVVDTGSNDNTMDIASDAGAKVFSYPWQFHFAKARNYALDRATGDWVLVLDADETLDYVDAGRFNGLLVNPQIDGYFINIESYIGTGGEKVFDSVVRLFRNKPDYRFTGAIHEQVTGSIRENRLACTDLKIIHSGYLNETIRMKNKHSRNTEVINKALMANPCNPFLLYSLGVEYSQQGNMAEANAQFAKALQYLQGTEGYFHNVVLNLSAGLIRVGQIDQAKKTIDQAMTMLPQDCDLSLLAGIVALYKNDYERALQFLQRSLAGHNDKVLLGTIHTLCGDAYATLRHYNKAEAEYLTSLALNPHHLYPLLQIIGCKQQGTSRLSWHAVSHFTVQGVNRDLQKKLIEMGELPVVLVLALLNILNRNGECNPDFITACKDYIYAVALHQPADDLSKITIDYLKLSAEQIITYVETDSHCPLWPVIQKIDKIVCNNLDLIIKALCPTWIPCISPNDVLSAKKD